MTCHMIALPTRNFSQITPFKRMDHQERTLKQRQSTLESALSLSVLDIPSNCAGTCFRFFGSRMLIYNACNHL